MSSGFTTSVENSDATFEKYYFSCSGKQIVTLDFGREISAAFSLMLWFRPKEPASASSGEEGGEGGEEDPPQVIFIIEDSNDRSCYIAFIYFFRENYIAIEQSVFGYGVSRRRVLVEGSQITPSTNS